MARMKIRLARKIDKWIFAIEGCNFRMQSLDESTGEICQGEKCRHCYYGKIFRKRNYTESQIGKAKYMLGKIWYYKMIYNR